MAGNIKGITVEIGGDTTKLGKALKDIDNQSKSLQEELKKVNNDLKFNPSNTELLSQKQELLKQKVSQTSDRLKVLKSSQKEVQEQFDKGEITQEQFRQFQREIVETESKLKHFKNQAKDFGSVFQQQMERAGKKVSEVGSKVEGAGKKLSSTVTTGVVATATASIAAFNTVDEGYDNVAKATGATGDALKGLQSSYEEVYGSMNVEAGVAGQAVGDLNTRFGFTGQVLTNASKDFLKFAEINNTDVTTAIKDVSRYMGDASIPANEYSSVLDILTKSSQASGIAVDKLAEDCTKYGAPMRNLGLTTKESVAIFSTWEKAGVNTEIAFSGMKKAIGTWGKQGKDATTEFKKTLKAIQECPDKAKATSEAIAVFGQKAGPDLADAIQGGRFSYEDFMKIIGDSKDTVKNTFEATEDPIDKCKADLNKLKLSGAELGATFIETLKPAIDKITAIVSKLSEKFKSLSPTQQKLITNILSVAAVVGPILLVIGKFATAIGSIISICGKLGTAFKGIKAMMAGLKLSFITSPFFYVPALIAGIIAVLVILYKHCKPFHDFIDKLWAKIKKFFTDVPERFEKFKEGVRKKATAFKNFIKTNFLQIGLFILNPFVGTFAMLYKHCAGFRNFVNGFVGKIKTSFINLGNNIKNKFTSIVDWFKSIPDSMMQIGENIVKGIWNGITNCIGWLKDKIHTCCTNIVSFFTDSDGLDIHSPSRVLENQVGMFIPSGIGAGISKNMKSALAPIRAMNQQIVAESSKINGINIQNEVKSTFGNSSTSSTTKSANLQSTAKRSSQINLVINGKAFASAIVNDLDLEQGNTITLSKRGVKV